MRLRQCKGVSFSEFLHEYYKADGTTLIGVTGLLHKHSLAPDMSSIPEDVLAKAAERGTAIHSMLERYDNGEAVIEDENLIAYKSLGLDVARSEYMVSDGEVVATFIDKVLEDCSLVDVKSWAQVDPARRRYVTWQQSVGAYLFEKQNPSKKVPHIYMARVRDGKAELVELNRIPDEEVKALIEAEKAGVKYMDNSVPSVSTVFQDGEVEKLVRTLDIIAEYKAYMKEQEKVAKELQDRLYNHMVDNHLDEMKCSSGVFILKSSYERTSVDADMLQKDLPEVFAKYKKITTVKGSVSFKVNTKQQ